VLFGAATVFSKEKGEEGKGWVLVFVHKQKKKEVWAVFPRQHRLGRGWKGGGEGGRGA